MGLIGKGAAVAAAMAAVMAGAAVANAQPVAHPARVGQAPQSQPLQLVLPLQADLAGLRRRAAAVTTPGSPLYGAYEPIAELARRYGASPSTRTRVVTYLRAAGASDVAIDPTGLFANATVSVGLAERMFKTPLAQYRADHGVRFIAPTLRTATAASVPVPAALQGAVTGVVGLDTRPLSSAVAPKLATSSPRTAHLASQPSSAQPRTGTPAGCPEAINSGGFTPNQILTAYGYDPLSAAGLNGQGVRVALIEIDGFNYGDIQTFAKCFNLPIPAIHTYGVGLSRKLAPGGESTLDLEVLDAAASGLSRIDLYETRSSAADTLRAMTAPLGPGRTPQVISASLGLCEPAVAHAVGNAGITATEGSLQMAAASGVTFLASSGDQGSADCTTSNGTPFNALAVNYPASSWWVTGVGGTNLVLSPTNQIVSQVVWDDTTEQPGSAGGGGESALFTRPNYQKGSPYPDSRAVPDVSMLSDIIPGYAIFCSASPDCVNTHNTNPWVAIGGTSAATPLLAGGFARIDQGLRTNRREALGLVNPLLYRTARVPGVFYDVTSYGNDVGPDIPGNGQPLGCCAAGPGYDDASGLGSVNVAAFAAQALAAQPLVVSLGIRVPGGQRPVRSRHLLATVSCSGPCVMGAYAMVTIGRSKPFEVDSNVFRLRAAGSKTIKVSFSGRQLANLRSALAAGKRITATLRGALFDSSVYGVLPDPANSFRQSTPGKNLTISG